MNGDKKLALITGAGNGIGQAAAVLLAQRGWVVGVNDLKPEFVEQTMAMIAGVGGRGIPVVQDISSQAGVQAAVDEVVTVAGTSLSAMVNNAAWVRYGPIEEIEERTVERMMRIGFSSVIWGIQAAAGAMDSRQGGAIVNVSSAAAFRSAPLSLVYSGIKAGIGGLTRAAAAELGAKGIRVNAVAPSAIPTKGTERNRNAERDAARVARTPMGRLGTVDDIARAIAYFASDDSVFVTGQVMLVDGGINTANL